MISSAPARQGDQAGDHGLLPKLARLFELYGSTEAGWVTMLHPDEQFRKLGSVGRECIGSGRDYAARRGWTARSPDGEVGELYSRTPYVFDGYWNLPGEDAEEFRGPYCSVGDMARRDADGYLLSGRPQEQYDHQRRREHLSLRGRSVLGAHPAIKDVAVIGAPDPTMGRAGARRGGSARRRTPRPSRSCWRGAEQRIAGFKRPRALTIIADAEMPRTATGKIQHRLLRERIVTMKRAEGAGEIMHRAPCR